jgi:hypothetical protein
LDDLWPQSLQDDYKAACAADLEDFKDECLRGYLPICPYGKLWWRTPCDWPTRTPIPYLSPTPYWSSWEEYLADPLIQDLIADFHYHLRHNQHHPKRAVAPPHPSPLTTTEPGPAQKWWQESRAALQRLEEEDHLSEQEEEPHWNEFARAAYQFDRACRQSDVAQEKYRKWQKKNPPPADCWFLPCRDDTPAEEESLPEEPAAPPPPPLAVAPPPPSRLPPAPLSVRAQKWLKESQAVYDRLQEEDHLPEGAWKIDPEWDLETEQHFLLEQIGENYWEVCRKYRKWERNHPPPPDCAGRPFFLPPYDDSREIQEELETALLPPSPRTPPPTTSATPSPPASVPRRSLRLNPELALERLEGPITRKRRWDALKNSGNAASVAPA